MAKYMIHACLQRMWYVDGYLIPSMKAQGISTDDITLMVDTGNLGCLESCMRAFESVPYADGTWHLQDDVVISSRFRELTEQYDTGIACGHAWYKHKGTLGCIGRVRQEDMWFSFPCIRIPDYLARGCAKFYRDTILAEKQYEPWVKARRYDDTVFSLYLQTHGAVESVTNIVPNLVAHIDYLLGGSAAKGTETEQGEEPYFDEPETMKKLIEWIERGKHDG